MLKKLLSTLLPFLAASCDKPQDKTPEVALMDPNKILFSLATLCDPIPATQAGTPSGSHNSLHEDDWRQIEFVPMANRDYIKGKLTELNAFKQANQQGPGFTKVFIRPEHPTTFVSADLKATQLPRLTETALTLGGGIVEGGFALSDGGDWFIYGQRLPNGTIVHLGISPGHTSGPSEAFMKAISELSGTDFMLVDWYAGVVVETATAQTVQKWAHRFQ